MTKRLIKPIRLEDINLLAKQIEAIQEDVQFNGTTATYVASGWYAVEAVKILADEVVRLTKEVLELKETK